MAGKTVLITGATNGIGLVTARALTRMGATVVLVGRDGARANRLAEDLRREAPDCVVHALIADLSSQAQIRRLAGEVHARFKSLDVLVNNAGAVFARRHVSVDGAEMTLALNHLAPFLLTNLLLDMLKASPQGRVITVASVAHIGAHVPFDDMNHSHGWYNAFGVYGQTKLMNLMFTYELARRLAGTSLTANALHPGFVGSQFGRNNGAWWNLMFTVAKPFTLTPEVGAQTSIYLASSPEVAPMSGKYFVRRTPSKSSADSYDQAAQQRLWTVSEHMTGLAPVLAE